jgi:hypothetical protein
MFVQTLACMPWLLGLCQPQQTLRRALNDSQAQSAGTVSVIDPWYSAVPCCCVQNSMYGWSEFLKEMKGFYQVGHSLIQA